MNNDSISSDFSNPFTVCDFSPSNLRIIDVLLRSSPDIVLVTDSAERFVYVGSTAAQMLQRSPEEILGKTIHEIALNVDLPVNLIEFLAENHRAVLTYRQSLTGNFSTQTSQGSRHYQYTFSPVGDSEGETCAVLSVGRDVTEQIVSENERRLLAAIVDSSEDAIIGKNLDGIIVSWNRAAETIFGYTAGEIIGKPKTVLFPQHLLSEETAILRRIRAGERTEHFETVRVHKDGTLIDVSVHISPIRDATGLVIGASTIIRDITSQKRMERQLQRAEAERQATEATMNAILDNAPVSIFTKDREGRYTFINRRAEELLPAPREQMLGHTNFDFYPQEEAAKFHADDMQVVQTGITILREGDYSLPDGLHTFITVKFALWDSDQTIYALCGIITDITERKQLQAQLYQSQKMEGIGRLAGGIAHDFNNLLTAIMGYTELAAMDLEPDSAILPHLDIVQQTAQRAAALTRQLLAFARKQILQPEVFSLNDLILDADKLLRRVIGADVELVTLPAADLRYVKADPNQLTQVLVNLAVNARDAMPHGGKLNIETHNVTLDAHYARQHAEVQPGDYVMMVVGDTGTGMTEEVKARLFEPFFTTKEPGKGTGLGLATCYGIVKQNDGHIWVYSEPGHGTIFKVYLPVVNEPPSVLHKPDTAPAIPTGTETILLAEDDSVVRSLATQILEDHGYRVLVASNGSEALRLAAETTEEIHLLITDVVMPHLGGRELSRRLLTLRPGLKILFVSGYTENSIVHHGILDAGIAFLQKPYMPAILARKVRELLDEG